MVKTELYFGRTIGIDEYVTGEQWEKFVDEYISSRFPAGFSILDVSGRWKCIKTGKTIREDTKLLVLCHHRTTNDDNHLREIIKAYKDLFDQDSVMLVEYEVNAAF